ncbi:MAG: dihydroorotate dehydrogenase-like protein [Pseudomonadota bacterium]
MDLSTNYMGLTLANPVVPSASPLSRTLEGVQRMAEAGAGAIVLHSLFEEQLNRDADELNHYLERGTESFAEALSYFPAMDNFNVGPDDYLERIRKAKQSTSIPIIGSLNGVSAGGWTSYAAKMEQAGADAIELNVYWIPTDPKLSATSVEKVYLDILKAVRGTVKIPVAMKLSPFFSAPVHMARQLEEAGASGLVLFNRFYQPDVDLGSMGVVTDMTLSSSSASRLPLRWIAILREHIKGSLAATSGVHTAEDALKLVMVGADVTMVCAVLLQKGIGAITTIRDGMARWLEQHEYTSLAQAKGSMSQKNCAEPAAYERAHYVKALEAFKL